MLQEDVSLRTEHGRTYSDSLFLTGGQKGSTKGTELAILLCFIRIATS